MSQQTPACPDCREALTRTTTGELDRWVCAQAHGAAATLSEAHGVAQDDELAALWQQAKQAATRQIPCPMCESPMAQVAVPYDADEEPGVTGEPLGEAEVEVCVACQVVWFEPGELEQLPADLPEPQLSPEQRQQLDSLTASFGEAIDAAQRERDERDVAERIYQRLARRPRLLGFLQRHGH